MVTIKPVSEYIPKASHKFMKSMASGGLARFIMLEAFVETGRTWQAYQRGGFDEGRERITEEFTGAVFWMGGVKGFNAINDRIGKAILKMSNAKFDLGVDKARNTVENFIYEEAQKGNNFEKSTIAKFKTAKLVASILMANIMIGFVVPKINQAITRYYHRNDAKPQVQNIPDNNLNAQNEVKQETPVTTPAVANMKDFMSKTKAGKKDISFGGFNLMSFANLLENNTTVQLLSTDVGTATGRTISARNNNERREILFRDLSSIIFYMFCMPLMNKLLNVVEQNNRSASRVGSMNADYTTDLMKQIVKENGGKITAKVLGDEMLGANKDYKLPDSFREMFPDGYIEYDPETFKEKLKLIPEVNTPEKLEQYNKLAEEMSKLQPAVNGKPRITLEQIERMFKGGYLNNPEFLKNLYELEYGKGKKAKLPKFLDPYKFVSSSDIEGLDKDLRNYIEKIINKANKTGKEITEEVLEKACKKNFRLNAFNWGVGFAISATFLSTIIPKVQYWITRRMTGSNEFPGTEEFRNKQA